MPKRYWKTPPQTAPKRIMKYAVCKNCRGDLVFRRRSKRDGEKLYTCSGCGQKWQSRGIGIYQVAKPRDDSKIRIGLRIYPDHRRRLAQAGISVQALLDAAVLAELRNLPSS